MKLTKKDVLAYMVDCIGYGEDEANETWEDADGCISDILEPGEIEQCKLYNN
jgi:hypothetical protein